jgi:hypothetical protein
MEHRRAVTKIKGTSTARKRHTNVSENSRDKAKWKRLKKSRNIETPSDLPQYDELSPFPKNDFSPVPIMSAKRTPIPTKSMEWNTPSDEQDTDPTQQSRTPIPTKSMEWTTEEPRTPIPTKSMEWTTEKPRTPIPTKGMEWDTYSAIKREGKSTNPVPIRKPQRTGNVQYLKLDRDATEGPYWAKDIGVRKRAKRDPELTSAVLPDFNLDFEDFQRDVMRKFGPESKYKYKFTYTEEDVAGKDGCKRNSSKPFYELSKQQNFLNAYFRPENPMKGMLVYHDVGTGKTCLAISMLSRVWLPAGYSVLWVTRPVKQLQEETYDAMLKDFCDVNLRKQVERDPDLKDRIGDYMNDHTKREAFHKYIGLSGYNWGKGSSKARFLTYREFEEVCNPKVFNNRTAVLGVDNREDRLKKTIIVIDEAHNLFPIPNDDNSTKEAPGRPETIESAIFNSYKISGKDSCRVVLLTGTPYLQDLSNFMRLLNLIQGDASKRLPVRKRDIMEKVVNNPEKFKQNFKGMISHISYEFNASVLPQKKFMVVNVQMEPNQADEIARCMKRKTLEKDEDDTEVDLRRRPEGPIMESPDEMSFLESNAQTPGRSARIKPGQRRNLDEDDDSPVRSRPRRRRNVEDEEEEDV